MNVRNIVILLILIIIGAVVLFFGRKAAAPKGEETKTMKITSPAFAEGGTIPTKYTCKGDGINPPLNLEDVPKETQSLALIVDDPDAPGGTWVHWVMWNIDPHTAGIMEHAQTDGASVGANSSGNTKYDGPCPPDREHRYFFKFYALDSKLELAEGSNKQDLLKAMEGHIIAQGELMGKFAP